MADYHFVQRDQCNGVTLACVNCQAKLGERHNIMCYAMAKARKEASGREMTDRD